MSYRGRVFVLRLIDDQQIMCLTQRIDAEIFNKKIERKNKKQIWNFLAVAIMMLHHREKGMSCGEMDYGLFSSYKLEGILANSKNRR